MSEMITALAVVLGVAAIYMGRRSSARYKQQQKKAQENVDKAVAGTNNNDAADRMRDGSF